MARNTHILTTEHQWFINENRHDPITHKTFNIGDQVVVCSGCKKVFKATTWDEAGGHCPLDQHKYTQSQFLSKPENCVPVVLGIGKGIGNPNSSSGSQPRETREGIRIVGERRPYIEPSSTSSQRSEPHPQPPPPKKHGCLIAAIIIILFIILILFISFKNGFLGADTSVELPQTNTASIAEVFENSPTFVLQDTPSDGESYAEAPIPKYYSWHWNEDDIYYINNNATSIAEFDKLVEDVIGFTIGIKLDKGDTGWWSIYIYTGDGGTIDEANLVGNVWVDSVGEWYYADIKFSKRDIYWVLFLGPIGINGYCNIWTLYGSIDNFIEG